MILCLSDPSQKIFNEHFEFHEKFEFKNYLHLTLMFANKLLKGWHGSPFFASFRKEIQILLDMCYFTGIMNFFVVVQKLVS